MSVRYNDAAYLGTKTYTYDKYHNQVATVAWRKVYVNRFYDNITLQQQAAVNDGRQLAQYELRTSEYQGEQIFKVDDVLWTVQLASRKGDNTVLTVETEIGNNGTQ